MRQPKPKPQPAYVRLLTPLKASSATVALSSATPQRHGDRANDDDGDAGDAEARLLLPLHCRFADLDAAGIVHNWPTLLRMVDEEDFPPGKMISRNVRAWEVDEVRHWLGTRPTARKVVPPAKKPRRRRTK
jgi:hypothetical protein